MNALHEVTAANTSSKTSLLKICFIKTDAEMNQMLLHRSKCCFVLSRFLLWNFRDLSRTKMSWTVLEHLS